MLAVADPTIESAQALMRHPGIRLLVVTGGPGVVKEAMNAGKKVIAAGPGNPPAMVDETADLARAAKGIIKGASIDNNPTYGNKQGGLTTIYEKSLGAVAKGGQSPLMAVYDYAQKIDQSGFGFMDTPGYDPVSMTGLVCGGCTIGCFTTGRGSVYGCKPAPCIKIATNTPMYQRMTDDMDINAGTILDGTETVEQVGARIFEKIIAVASGEQTKSELAGIGDEEFAPWILGPTF